MACIQKLKDDIGLLESLFPKTHERVQIRSSSLDEVSIRFVKPDTTHYDLVASIVENYPRTAPLWFSDSEDGTVSSVIEELASSESPSLLHQFHQLVSRLCELNQLTVPAELLQIMPNQEMDEGNGTDDDGGSEYEADDVEMSEYEDMVDDTLFEQHDGAGDSKPEEDAPPEAIAILNKVVHNQRQAHMKGNPTGSVSGNSRLMREVREIYASDAYKNKVYTIELVNDNLYEWNVHLLKVDDDSQLSKDMKQLARENKPSYLHFKFHFKDTFPFEPPFVHLVSPSVQNGFVLSGGALCMELLTKQGWSSAYSVESVVLQIAATLVKGKARINFESNNSYTMARAQQSFKSLVSIHQKSGWYTPPSADG
uniref:UBC core domain-containing protein n=1 Tax=Panagrellus redivivus TaxID=6233 RepID=A0A7E4VG28_PANRE